MLGRVVEELRKAGLRKIVIFIVLAAIAVVLAYGDNSTDDAASGATLPRSTPAAVVRVAVPHFDADAAYRRPAGG